MVARWRPRFSLRTLVVAVIFVSSLIGLWWRWEPWGVVLDLDELPTEMTSAGFSSDGRFIFSVSGAGERTIMGYPTNRLLLWDAETGRKHLDAEAGFGPAITSGPGTVEFSPQGTWMQLDSHNGIVHACCVWNVENGAQFRALGCSGRSVQVNGFSWDERVAFVELAMDEQHEGALVRSGLVEVPSGRVIVPCSAGSWAHAFSHDKRWFAVPEEGKDIRLYSLCDGSMGVLFKDWGQLDSGLAFSPDDRLLAAFRWPGECVILDLATGKPLWQCGGRLPYSRFLGAKLTHLYEVFSPDSRLILIERDDQKQVEVRDTRTGEVLLVLRDAYHKGGVVDMRFSQDGTRILATGNSCGSWDAVTGQRLWCVEEGSFSTDERRAITVSSDEELRLLDATSGRRLCSFRRSSWFRGAAFAQHSPFSPDGEGLLTLAPDGRRLRVWRRVRPEDWWGIAWLPEFWVAYFSGGALLVIAARILRAHWAAQLAAQPAAQAGQP